MVGATAGYRVLVNSDGVLTPDDASLVTLKQSATQYRGTLHVIVKLLGKQIGDVLSLRSGYVASKVTPRWDGSKGELSIEFDSAAKTSHMKTAFELLEFNSEFSASASTREVWVFPVLSGANVVRYRVDEPIGLVRHYVSSPTRRSFSDSSGAASSRIPFWQAWISGRFHL